MTKEDLQEKVNSGIKDKSFKVILSPVVYEPTDFVMKRQILLEDIRGNRTVSKTKFNVEDFQDAYITGEHEKFISELAEALNKEIADFIKTVECVKKNPAKVGHGELL